VTALTGAVCSTASGIPDYGGLGRPPSGRKPIVHDEFLRLPEVRQRYWARATLGWQHFSRALPNGAHRALAAMEASGWLGGLITQNVDRLHHAAGSRAVIELHGALAEVVCLDCQALTSRAPLQERLLAANPGWLSELAQHAPDGDADLRPEQWRSFQVVGCESCGGRLKPHVVLFGGRVADAVVEQAHALVAAAEVLLVVGSSLAVYSGWRFVQRAFENGLPVAVINLGATRADGHGALKVASRADEILPWLAASRQIVGAQPNRVSPAP